MKNPDAKRLIVDNIVRSLMFFLAVFFGSIIFIIFIGLFIRSKPILDTKPITHLLFSSDWHPLKQEFGFLSFITGTFWVTGIALLFAVPTCILSSIFLAEYAPSKIQKISGSLVDLLAGIPSVIYGIWGVLFVVPLVKDHIAPIFGVQTSGYCILSGGIVLAIMISPIIINLSVEIIKSVPKETREVSLALGATKWQTIKLVVLKKAFPGLLASVILGFSRALGETMAVLMVVGNVAKIPGSIFDPAYPIPALIANNYGEMMSIPLYDSAILLAALILMLIVLFFNILSRIILIRIERSLQ